MTESPRAALVTGGASGIGLGIVERLGRDGHPVVIADVRPEVAEAEAERLRADGLDVHAVGVDVSKRGEVEAAFAAARGLVGPITILVNAAGKDGFSSFRKITPDEWEQLLAINLSGPFHCIQVALPDMVDAGWGRVVNISSSSTHSGQPFMAHYVSAKSGVNGLTKALALELGPRGVTVNAIPPGFIDTPMLRKAEAAGQLAGTVEDHEARTPVRRVGTPADIAAMCAFLVSDEAGYVTGQILGVNGGRNT